MFIIHVGWTKGPTGMDKPDKWTDGGGLAQADREAQTGIQTMDIIKPNLSIQIGTSSIKLFTIILKNSIQPWFLEQGWTGIKFNVHLCVKDIWHYTSLHY